MADCRSNDKSNFQETDLSSITKILKIISKVLKYTGKPPIPIPPPLLLIGKNLRPGMSARNLAARVISRLESDANIPMGDVFADGSNSEAKKVRVMSEEIVNMIQTEAKVDIAIDPGAIQITAAGSAGPIPVIVQGANTLFATGGGGVR